MKSIFSMMKKVLQKNAISLLFFELLFRITTLLAVLPAVTKLLELSMRVQGWNYVTNQNIFEYLRHPLTLLVLLIAAGIVLIMSAVEYACLFVCFYYSNNGMKITTGEMFLEGLELIRHKELWKWGIWQMFVCLPSVNLWMLAIAIEKVQALNYIAEYILRSEVAVKLLFILIVFLFWLEVLFFLPMTSVYFDAASGKKTDSTSRSWRRWSKGRFPKNMLYCLSWDIMTVAVTLLCVVVMIGVVALYLVWNPMSGYTFARILVAGERIVMIAGLLSGLIGTLVHVSGMYALYYILQERAVGRLEMKRRFSNQKEMLQPRKKKITVLIFSLAAAVELIFIGNMFFRGSYNVSDYLSGISITAHRGASKQAPENTLPALEYAIAQFADYAEIDVQEAADGTIFLLHDTTLARVCRDSRSAYQLTYDELLQLDVGAWFGSDFVGTRIPTLQEAIDLCRGKIKLNIEIKENRKTPDVVRKTVEIIEAMDFTTQCVITSTSQAYLEEVKKYNPNIRTGLILKVSIGDIPRSEAVDFLSMKYSNVTEELVAKAHAYGMEVHVWTVNTASMMERMAEYDVDGIITDNCLLATEVLQGASWGEGLLSILQELVRQMEQ